VIFNDVTEWREVLLPYRPSVLCSRFMSHVIKAMLGRTPSVSTDANRVSSPLTQKIRCHALHRVCRLLLDSMLNIQFLATNIYICLLTYLPIYWGYLSSYTGVEYWLEESTVLRSWQPTLTE
jgi:hypothetical protein